MKELQSYQDLQNELTDDSQSFVLLYKKGSESSDCALAQLHEAAQEANEERVFSVDVNKVRDIHTQYKITSAPTLMVFTGNEIKNTYKGCNGKDFFKGILENQVFAAGSENAKSQPSVEVYSTPTCSWCNKLKTYLNKNGIRYSDINVAASASVAEELVRQTGQQGVPQTNIGGEWIVGFDKKRIDQLLNINA